MTQESNSKAQQKPKIDKFALAKRFLNLGEQEQAKFIALLDAKGMSFEKLPIAPAEEVRDVPLSPAQKRLWDIYQLDAGNSAYHISGGFELIGDLSTDKMELALAEVMSKHHALRTRFVVTDQGEPRQHADQHYIAHVELKDGRNLTENQLGEWTAEFIAKPFDLLHEMPVRMAYIRASEDKTHVIIVMHHIVSDGWSIGLFIQDLVAAYQGESLKPLSIQYSDFSVWQDALLKAGKGDEDLQFWQQELCDKQPQKLFEWTGDIAPNQRREAQQISLEFDGNASQRIARLARQNNVTTSSFWLAIWQAALFKLTGRNDINIGMPMANRARPEASDVIGFFVNTNVVAQDVKPEHSFGQIMTRAHSKVLEIQEHQLLPFDRVVSSLLTERLVGETPYFQVLFNHQVNQTESVEFAPGVAVKPLLLKGNFALFDVALDVLESSNGTQVTLTFAKDRIDPEMMVSLTSTLNLLVSQAEQNLNTPVAALNSLDEAQLARLSELSQPEGEWRYQPVTDLFDLQGMEQPSAIALKHGQQSVSFKQLEEKSNQLANQLVEQGVVRDQAVGVLFERGNDMIIAMIAIMKAGGAFLPLDPDYPTDRLAYMIKGSAASLVISDQSLHSRWEEIDSHVLSNTQEVSHSEHASKVSPLYIDELDWQGLSKAKPEVELLPEQLAYIIYTSGSTGKPKGVAIAHDGLSMHVQTIGAQYGMTQDDVELHFASISFDGAVERWTVPLAFGSRLVIRDQQLWSAEKTCDVLKQEGITIACFPPSYVGPLLDWIETTQPQLNVRSWTLGGEAFTRETYDRLQSVVNPPRIINGYGPTETVVTPMIWRAYPHDKLTSAYAPIGQPVGARRLYVLDGLLNQVAEGAVGELYIGEEVGLARGYLGKPDMTSERFMPDPFTSNGERMYRTGDLVRWREDGVMEYFGRVDQQIKIRGFRIELGEIESRLQQISGVETCVVAAHRHGSMTHLVGYLHGADAEKTDSVSILSELAEHLPEYMVPAHLVVLDSLPLTPAGKVDRNSLPEPEFKSVLSQGLPPQDEKETLLAEVWQELLGIESVSREDSFFALGGDSILSLQLVSKLKLAGLNVSPKQVFQAPVLSELAQVLEAAVEQEQRELPKEPFGLMPIQAHFMAQNFAQSNHWNQHVCVELKQDMDIQALDTALKGLVEHHPALRLSFSKNEGKWQQQYVKNVSYDLLWKTQLDSLEAFEVFAHELQTSLDIGAGRLIQAGYAQIEGQKSRLMIVIHHLAVDGVSWRILMDDLWRAYQQTLSSDENSTKTVELPPVYTSLDMAVGSLNKWASTEQGKARKAVWDEQAFHAENTHAKAIYGNKRSLKVELSREVTSVLLSCENIIVELVSALSATMGSNEGTQSVYLESHGRDESVFEGLDLSRMVGWMTSLYPMTLNASDSRDDIADRMALLSQDSGIGYGLRYLDGEPQEQGAALTFNYLGQYQGNSFAHWCQPVSSNSHDQADGNTMLTPLVINAQVVDGVLSADFEYATSHYSQSDIEAKADTWKEKIELLHSALKSQKGEVIEAKANLKLIEKLNANVAGIAPVFCIHPVTGRTVGYQKLAQALAGKRTVYGVQSQSFVYPNRFDTSFSAMADTYCATIREIQPSGPYTLIGWSLGGALCQEVTARLEAAGESVAFLGLLDCYVPGTEIAEDQWESPKAKTKLIEHLELLLGKLSEGQKQICLAGFDQSSPDKWPNVFSSWLAQQNFDHYLSESAQQMLYSWAVEQHMRALCHNYTLPKILTKPVAYWAGQPQGRDKLLREKLSAVNALLSSKVFDTDHLGIVQDERVVNKLGYLLINNTL
ncbi:amino acid adenylation domain-containing protein [Vibrio europaeus]|uniref:Amino acid adenylation domain-containing protein n=1 Tax=Vibrio europaeus TaxID=300876 RepID=A0A178J7R2_9VIBR|nr:non-ribosomal peptide synthetase [Vibrio europaeus]MDC5705047.1 amino acid adenylation domain-containing protein [Vibrio europaeus]MDC5710326.1 amino acid adenylation domain-containing protein [Vibrio europaeus]MDC5715416.1 amino acid adenylation domain-containing protein [Vibrio europaeus]MDC5719577.1 amino acid adenylation domain-containing protein [Vibrio europaeus]MDC5724535.1 amino acid adenylation domain-containing protein [Vibrio europaeus]